MYCINCGNKLKINDKFCTSCGKKVESNEISQNKPPTKSFSWKTFILTGILTSIFWFVYYFGFVSTNTESANIVGHLLETVGRQQQAWDKSEQIIELIAAGISDECLYTVGCVEEVGDQITTLRTEIDKESSEIDNLWSENVIGNDFDIYYSSLDETDKTRLMDIMDLYFPEEFQEMGTSVDLL